MPAERNLYRGNTVIFIVVGSGGHKDLAFPEVRQDQGEVTRVKVTQRHVNKSERVKNEVQRQIHET